MKREVTLADAVDCRVGHTVPGCSAGNNNNNNFLKFMSIKC